MKIRRGISLIVAACAAVLGADAATPPVGTWQAFILLNKTDLQLSHVTLTIQTPGGTTLSGPISGSICAIPCVASTQTQINGFWNDDTKTLLFYRKPPSPSQDFDSIQIYTGHVYPCTAGSPRQCLGGSFEAFANSGGSAQKNVMGWHATVD